MEGIAVKCPVCDQLNTSMLCPHCGFDASRDYENYPTFGIVDNAVSATALRQKRNGSRVAAEQEKQQLLDRVAELERQMRSMTATNRLLLEKLSHLERAVSASAGQKPNRLRADPIRIPDQTTFSSDDAVAYPVFGSTLRRDQIASVTFLDTLADAPQDAWDVSADNSSTVQAWAVPDGELYDLYLAADGEIKAPESCKDLFAGYCNMRRIRFGDCFDTFRVRNMGSMFYSCSSLTALDLKSFNTSCVQNMGWMFSNCSSLMALDLSCFNTSCVQKMSWMFSGCSSLTKLDLSNFDTSSVQDMRCMFSDCSSLTKLDLSSFDTSRVQNMHGMFFCCYSLTKLDLSSFDTSSALIMGWMFFLCSSLTTLDLSSFDTARVQDMRCMFYNCSSLTTLKRSGRFIIDGASTYKMFNGCPAGE